MKISSVKKVSKSAMDRILKKKTAVELNSRLYLQITVVDDVLRLILP